MNFKAPEIGRIAESIDKGKTKPQATYEEN